MLNVDEEGKSSVASGKAGTGSGEAFTSDLAMPWAVLSVPV